MCLNTICSNIKYAALRHPPAAAVARPPRMPRTATEALSRIGAGMLMALLSAPAAEALGAGRPDATAPAFDVPDAGMPEAASPVSVNDNRTPAGKPETGVLHLHLRAARGVWRPEGEDGRVLGVEAFGEVGKSLQVPAPLIRIRQGTAIAGTIRNDLDSPLGIHGLCARDGTPCLPIEVAPGEARRVPVAERRARHVPLLGNDQRNAADLPGRGRHAVVWCVRRGSARRSARSRPHPRHHGVDGADARATAGDRRRRRIRAPHSSRFGQTCSSRSTGCRGRTPNGLRTTSAIMCAGAW